MKTTGRLIGGGGKCWTARDASGTLHGFVAEKELRRLLSRLAATELLGELAKSLAVRTAPLTCR